MNDTDIDTDGEPGPRSDAQLVRLLRERLEHTRSLALDVLGLLEGLDDEEIEALGPDFDATAGQVIAEAIGTLRLLHGGPACRVCGCTQELACEGGCAWVEVDLCSSCSDPDLLAAHELVVIDRAGAEVLVALEDRVDHQVTHLVDLGEVADG